MDSDIAAAAGCNLTTQTPEVAQWIIGLRDPEQRLVIGAYAYLNGPLFVKVCA